MYGSMYNSECCRRYSLAEPTIAYANLELIKPSGREIYSFKYLRVSRLQQRGSEIQGELRRGRTAYTSPLRNLRISRLILSASNTEFFNYRGSERKLQHPMSSMSSSFVTTTMMLSSSPAHVVPTATDTFPRNTIPTSISYATPPIPTAYPPGGSPPQPSNTTLVQIGFSYALNYPDVLANNVTQRQIFSYIPQGIAFGMSLDVYDTTKSSAYITTLACFYLPSSNVSSLQSQLEISKTRNANTPLYDNPDPSTNSMMALINPGIPVTAEAVLNSSPASASTSNNGLSSGSRISIGVMVPVAIIAIFLLGLLFWRRRKSSRHNANKLKPTAEEKDTDSRIYEMAASTRRFELQEGEHEHELPAAERELRELQGDSRRRQELRGLECVQELDAGAGD